MGYTVHGVTKSRTRMRDFHFHSVAGHSVLFVGAASDTTFDCLTSGPDQLPEDNNELSCINFGLMILLQASLVTQMAKNLSTMQEIWV